MVNPARRADHARNDSTGFPVISDATRRPEAMAPSIDELAVCSPAKWTGSSARAATSRNPLCPTPMKE